MFHLWALRQVPDSLSFRWKNVAYNPAAKMQWDNTNMIGIQEMSGCHHRMVLKIFFFATFLDLLLADGLSKLWGFSGIGLRDADSRAGHYIKIGRYIFTQVRAVWGCKSQQTPELSALPSCSSALLCICTWFLANLFLKNPLPNPLCIMFLWALLCIRVYFLEKLNGKNRTKGVLIVKHKLSKWNWQGGGRWESRAGGRDLLDEAQICRFLSDGLMGKWPRSIWPGKLYELGNRLTNCLTLPLTRTCGMPDLGTLWPTLFFLFYRGGWRNCPLICVSLACILDGFLNSRAIG